MTCISVEEYIQKKRAHHRTPFVCPPGSPEVKVNPEIVPENVTLGRFTRGAHAVLVSTSNRNPKIPTLVEQRCTVICAPPRLRLERAFRMVHQLISKGKPVAILWEKERGEHIAHTLVAAHRILMGNSQLVTAIPLPRELLWQLEELRKKSEIFS